MTLVIARKFSERIVVVSDTMISDEHATKRDVIPGRLKSVVIGDYLSISYSGFADAAIPVIRDAQRLLRAKRGVDEILALLREHSRQGRCDFIVVSHVTSPSMYKIWNGVISKDADVFWIGNSNTIRTVRQLEDAMPMTPPPDNFLRAKRRPDL